MTGASASVPVLHPPVGIVLERRPVPAPELGSSLVGRVQELGQGRIRISGGAHCFVRQQELPVRRVVVRAGRVYWVVGNPSGSGRARRIPYVSCNVVTQVGASSSVVMSTSPVLPS